MFAGFHLSILGIARNWLRLSHTRSQGTAADCSLEAYQLDRTLTGFPLSILRRAIFHTTSDSRVFGFVTSHLQSSIHRDDLTMRVQTAVTTNCTSRLGTRKGQCCHSLFSHKWMNILMMWYAVGRRRCSKMYLEYRVVTSAGTSALLLSWRAGTS